MEEGIDYPKLCSDLHTSSMALVHTHTHTCTHARMEYLQNNVQKMDRGQERGNRNLLCLCVCITAVFATILFWGDNS